MNQYLALFYICQVAGIIMIVGAFILIYKQKIYVDKVTKQVVELELPWIGRIKTNAPALALFGFGLIATIYPVMRVKSPVHYLTVSQAVKSDSHPIAVYVVVHSRVLQQDGNYNIALPVLETEDYEPQILYVAGPIVDQTEIELNTQKGGRIALQDKDIQTGNYQNASMLRPRITPPPVRFK